MGHNNWRGPLGLVNNNYIDDGTMCRAPSPLPGVIGVSAHNTAGLNHWKKQEVLTNALTALQKTAKTIEASGAGLTQDIIDKAIGTGEGIGWFIKSTIEGTVDTVKWAYDYYSTGQAHNDQLLLILKLAQRMAKQQDVIYGKYSPSDIYSDVKQDVKDASQALWQVRKKINAAAGNAVVQFIVEYEQAAKEGKEDRVAKKYQTFAALTLVSAIIPVSRAQELNKLNIIQTPRRYQTPRDAWQARSTPTAKASKPAQKPLQSKP